MAKKPSSVRQALCARPDWLAGPHKQNGNNKLATEIKKSVKAHADRLRSDRLRALRDEHRLSVRPKIAALAGEAATVTGAVPYQPKMSKAEMRAAVEKQLGKRVKIADYRSALAGESGNLKMKQLKQVTIEFPQIMTVKDYHEFASIQDALKKLSGRTVKVVEINEVGVYTAVFYLGRQKDALKWAKTQLHFTDDDWFCRS